MKTSLQFKRLLEEVLEEMYGSIMKSIIKIQISRKEFYKTYGFIKLDGDRGRTYIFSSNQMEEAQNTWSQKG